MKKALTLAFALAAGSTLAAPFVYPAGWTADPNVNNKRGGELRLSTISDFKTINPFLSAESPSIPTMLGLGSGLFAQNPIDDEFMPYMAESMPKATNGGKRFVVKIRQGMKFSDGQEITADDWVSTAQIHKDDAVGSNSYDSFHMAGKPINVKKIDKYTLQFDFPQPSATAFETMAYTPWPDHIFGAAYRKSGAAGIKNLWKLNVNPKEVVTPGMWELESIRAGEKVTFTRNEEWGKWNKDSKGNALPYMDKLSYRIYADANAVLAGFLAGQIDFVAARNADDLAQIKKATSSGNLKATLLPNVSPQASSQYIVFNWNKSSDPFKQKLFRDARFRKAMSHLANRKAMVELILGGMGTETYHSVYPIFKNWIPNDLPKYTYNPAEATKLLAQIGFKKKNKDGWLVDSQGRVLEFDLLTNAGNTVREQLGLMFRDEAKKIGVKVNYRAIDFNSIVNAKNTKSDDRKFDATISGLVGGSTIYPFGDNVTPCGGNLHDYNVNPSGKCLAPLESTLTKLFYRGQQTLDTAARKDVARQLLKAEAELQPKVYLVTPNYHVIYNSRLGGQYPKDIMNAYYGSRDYALTWVK